MSNPVEGLEYLILEMNVTVVIEEDLSSLRLAPVGGVYK